MQRRGSWETCSPDAQGRVTDERGRVNTSAGDRLSTHTRCPQGTLPGRQTRHHPTASLWLLTQRGLYAPVPKLCRCWGPQGDKAELGAVLQDGFVLGVHLPGVGILHTDPGEKGKERRVLGTWWWCPSGVPAGLVDSPHMLITH